MLKQQHQEVRDRGLGWGAALGAKKRWRVCRLLGVQTGGVGAIRTSAR